jgi:hypothetical protein
MGASIPDEERRELFCMWWKMALPTSEDYASLCEWFKEHDIDYVQAPFQADSQMIQLINEERTYAAITEEVPEGFKRSFAEQEETNSMKVDAYDSTVD